MREKGSESGEGSSGEWVVAWEEREVLFDFVGCKRGLCVGRASRSKT